jgi:hypothetical protein
MRGKRRFMWVCTTNNVLKANAKTKFVCFSKDIIRTKASTIKIGPGFMPGTVHVGFVVDKVALGQNFLQVLQFSPVNVNPP